TLFPYTTLFRSPRTGASARLCRLPATPTAARRCRYRAPRPAPRRAELHPQAMPQAVVPVAERAELGLEQPAAGERAVGQAGEGVEAFGLAAPSLGQHLAGQVGIGDAVAAAALGVVDVVADAPHLGQARQGEQEVAGPGVVDLHPGQLREGLEHLGADDRLDVGGIPGAVDHAAAVDQTAVGGEPVVVEQVVAVLDTVVPGQQAARQLLVQGLGGDHLGPAGHGLGGQLRHQGAQVGIAGHHQEAGSHLALRGMHHRPVAPLDAQRRAVFVNDAAQGFERRRLAQRQIQGVDMAALAVQHTADVALAGHYITDALAVQQLQVGVAVALPQALLLLQVAHLPGGEGGEHAAILEIAGNAVATDPLADDAGALEGHLADQPRLAWLQALFDHIDVAAVAVDDLAAIAP